MATWSKWNLQDSSSPLMEQLSYFHDHVMMILLMITILVGYMLISLIFNSLTHRYLLEGQTIELIWTILPAITLIFIALPSLQLLYLLEESNNPMISVKTMGHQWYWSYELADFKNIEFDSYLNSDMESSFRLLDVDNRLPLPFKTHIRMMISATDVIHSWTIPSLAIKTDATPGRLNQISFFMKRPGLLMGQCSEICGTNHSFMPIILESISPANFIKWIKNF
nr:cytochrome c oxidase subunit II [Dromaeolus sp. ZM-2022]